MISGSLIVNKSSGTGLLGCSLFLASFQTLKLASAHLVNLSVLAGITPFASTDNSSSPTNFPKRLLVWVELGELLELEVKVRLLVWVELEALLIRVELEVSRMVIGDLCPAPGHPIHSHIPRQEEVYEQAILSSFRLIFVSLRYSVLPWLRENKWYCAVVKIYQ